MNVTVKRTFLKRQVPAAVVLHAGVRAPAPSHLLPCAVLDATLPTPVPWRPSATPWLGSVNAMIRFSPHIFFGCLCSRCCLVNHLWYLGRFTHIAFACADRSTRVEKGGERAEGGRRAAAALYTAV